MKKQELLKDFSIGLKFTWKSDNESLKLFPEKLDAVWLISEIFEIFLFGEIRKRRIFETRERLESVRNNERPPFSSEATKMLPLVAKATEVTFILKSKTNTSYQQKSPEYFLPNKWALCPVDIFKELSTIPPYKILLLFNVWNDAMLRGPSRWEQNWFHSICRSFSPLSTFQMNIFPYSPRMTHN